MFSDATPRRIGLAAMSLVGLAGIASAQRVALHFDADAENADRGDTIAWTVTASFTGYTDPTAYFGQFLGDFVASNDDLARVVGVESWLASSGGPGVSASATLENLRFTNLAIHGTDDPSNPIVVATFETVAEERYAGSDLFYDASGTCRVHPDNGILTEGDDYTEFEVTSDRVSIGGLVIDDLMPLSIEDGDKFGAAMARDGAFILIGAPGDDTRGEDAGAVYVIDTATDTIIHTLTASDGRPFDNFGNAVDADNGLAVIGSFRDNNDAFDSGSAYLFDIATGQELFKVTSNGPLNDWFGFSVAVEGDRFAVGALFEGLDSDTGHGAVYVYNTADASLAYKLLPQTTTSALRFGHALAMDSGRLFVGDIYGTPGSNRPGLVFSYDASNGSALQTFARGGSSRFGTSIDAEGDAVVIGDTGRITFSDQRTGSAHVFDADTAELRFDLFPGDGRNFDNFGRTVSIDATRVLVGAPSHDSGAEASGAVYLHDRQTNLVLDRFEPRSPVSVGFFGEAAVLAPEGIYIYEALDSTGRAGRVHRISPVETGCNPADLAEPTGVLDLADIGAFIDGFVDQFALSDLNGDGVFDLADIGAFVAAFTDGCP
jgi:hypothetical protein